MNPADDPQEPCPPSEIHLAAGPLGARDADALLRMQALALRALASLAKRAKARSEAALPPPADMPDLAGEEARVLAMAGEALALALGRQDAAMAEGGSDPSERAQAWARLQGAFLSPMPEGALAPLAARCEAAMLSARTPEPPSAAKAPRRI